MKYIFKFLVAIFLIYPSCKSSGNDENANPAGDKLVEQNYKVPEAYKIDSKEFLFDAFYPIGWSSDGKFAYALEPADEATGYYFFTLVIFDTHTRKIVWSWKIDEKNGQEGGNIKDTWTKNYKLFKTELNKNKIKQLTKFTLKQFPISLESYKIQFRHKIKYEKDKYYGFDVVSSAEFYIDKTGKRKIFYKEKFTNSPFLNINLIGYYKNPYGSEIFTLIHAEKRGYEGPPNVIRVKAGGCKLEK